MFVILENYKFIQGHSYIYIAILLYLLKVIILQTGPSWGREKIIFYTEGVNL